MTSRNNLKAMIFSSLFAALMIVGAYIKIPVGPVPIVLTNLFVITAGILLGPVWGMVSVGLYLLLGLIGLPVFSGGGGPGYFAGPTGGYLIGYLIGAGIAGLISRIGKTEAVWIPLGTVAGFAVIYLTGVPWLKFILDFPWGKAFTAGLIPFILGDAIKAAVVITVTITLNKTVPELLPSRKV